MIDAMRIWSPSGFAYRSPSQFFGRGPEFVNVWKINTSTDTLVWTFRAIGDAISIRVSGSIVYVGSTDGTAMMVYALNEADGALLWSVDVAWDSPPDSNLPYPHLTCDTGGNVYVGCYDGVRKYNTSGTLQGTFTPTSDPDARAFYVVCDIATDKLVGTFNYGTGNQIVKFNTSLSQLADTGAQATTISAITGYSEGTEFDDVWSDSATGLNGWWLQPPQDEPSLPPGFPPSYVDRRTEILGISDAFAPWVQGESIYAGYIPSTPADWYVRKYEGNTVDGVSVTWSTRPSTVGSSMTIHRNGARLAVCGFFTESTVVYGTTRTVIVLDEDDGTMTHSYVLGNASQIGGGNAVHCASSAVYVASTLAPRAMAVTI